MHLVAIVCAVTFVVVGTIASSVEEIKVLKNAFCDNKVMGDKIQKCFESLEEIDMPDEYETAKKECCSSIVDSKTGAEIRKWYCTTPVTTIQKCNECQEKKMKDIPNQEEIKKVMAPFEVS
ncbi:u9-Nephitoxin-Nsp1a_1 [Nephila pilipes]|uniref:U9-Nephitoxin-Nsp1a_1 n=1 Tax=Nephila pilipes TaxID=299642 RepID=A0A8X6Q6E6_NEPPI|nr:u9-Nephitoxin-Nsp1a_1 [Nephila pilipes]